MEKIGKERLSGARRIAIGKVHSIGRSGLKRILGRVDSTVRFRTVREFEGMRLSLTRFAAAWLLAIACSGAVRGEEAAESPLPPWGQDLERAEESPACGSLFSWFGARSAVEPEEELIPRFWIRPDYLMGWIRGDRTVPLVTLGESADMLPGALGQPFTKIIYGGEIDYKDRAGFRISGGAAIVEDCFDIDANYFYLGGRHPRFAAMSPGNPIIARPYFDLLLNMPSSSLTTYPGLLSGGLVVDSQSHLTGGELNALTGLCRTEHIRLRASVGLRYLNLRERIDIHETAQVTDPNDPLAGQTINVQDSFRTTNNFYGIQTGLNAEFRFRSFMLDVYGKCAVGDRAERVWIAGATDIGGVTVPGGLLALSSNSGSFRRDRFGYVPEGGLRCEAQLCRHVSMHVGYSFLFFGKVVRPGSQIDPVVNTNLVPVSNAFGAGGPARPGVTLAETDYYAHLFQFGVTLRY